MIGRYSRAVQHRLCMTVRALCFFAAVLFLAAPASAQESLYTVSGVHVDAGAASTTEAFNAAIAQGRGRAFQILYRRLTRQADWARQPGLDAQALLRVSRGYTIANERRSTTRYVADVTYMFNPAGVARMLRAANIAFSQTTAKRILVIPMSPGFGRGPWAQSLMAPSFRDALVYGQPGGPGLGDHWHRCRCWGVGRPSDPELPARILERELGLRVNEWTNLLQRGDDKSIRAVHAEAQQDVVTDIEGDLLTFDLQVLERRWVALRRHVPMPHAFAPCFVIAFPPVEVGDAWGARN